VLGVADLYDELDRLSRSVPDDALADLRVVLSGAVDRLARWYLSGRDRLTTSELVQRDRPASLEIDRLLVPPMPGNGTPLPVPPESQAQMRELIARGVPPAVAERAARLAVKAAVGEIAEVARASGKELEVGLNAHRAVSAGLSLPRFSDVLRSRAPLDRWERWQQHALVDELARLGATAAVLALGHHPALPGEVAGEEWLQANRSALARPGALVEQAVRTSAASLSLASLAVGTLAGALGS
jgi:glutamate dehydrogenase